ncbi:hypothetical protein PS2_034454 [Malus domestica]
MWRRLRRRKIEGQVQEPNKPAEVKSSKLDSGAMSTNCSEYASNDESLMVPDNSKPPLFNVPVKAACPEDEEILMRTN